MPEIKLRELLQMIEERWGRVGKAIATVLLGLVVIAVVVGLIRFIAHGSSGSRSTTITGNCNVVGDSNRTGPLDCSTKMLPQNTGVLAPANDPTPKWATCIPPGAFAVIMGRDIGYMMPPHDFGGILALQGEVVLAIEESYGNVVISKLKVFDSIGHIIVNVDKDGFWVYPLVRVKHKDASTLIVYDDTDLEVLNLRVINPTTVVISGVFRHPGLDPVIISPAPENTTIFGACATGATVAMFNVTKH